MDETRKYIKQLEKEKYITEDGTPLKCLYCDSKDLENINIMRSNYGIEEYDVQCKSCKKIVGRWGYGNWAL